MRTITPEQAIAAINSVCYGYSSAMHWNEFVEMLSPPDVKNVCILGVFQGRDIAYCATILQSLGRDYRIVGVDKFADTSNKDWPREKWGMAWEEAGFGKPPTLEQARGNLDRLGVQGVELVRMEAEEYLRKCEEQFCLTYVDTSHDYETTLETIRLAAARTRPGGVVSGDDFDCNPAWGVKRAVEESFSKFVVNGWVWRARVEDYRANPGT